MRNGTFGGAVAEKPLKRLTQNLAWVITSVTPLNTTSIMSIGLGGYPYEDEGVNAKIVQL